jgi:hypothetical protein
LALGDFREVAEDMEPFVDDPELAEYAEWALDRLA